MDSKKWITKANLEETIRDQLIIPHNLDFSEYYTRIRQQAFETLSGISASKYDNYNNREETQRRNLLLHPYFSELKSCIRHLTRTPEYELYEDFVGLKSRLYNYPEAINLLRTKFIKLAEASKALDSNNDVFLSRAHKQLGLLKKLLNHWENYISLAKLDEAQIMSITASLDGSNLDLESKLLDEDHDWDEDMKDPNPETSDYVEMHTPKREELL